ncbi:uncharacterized protein C8R40DRAFT_1041968 [Lentinula edodes]|uniref:uncharacterized protein n=1 Tax=Lentinula edodes TaxID=5353 RepID=UPI001E8DC716|nr:uncharacterized protein C8R40DRAFT_1041968 [Lentinula edodes]KAH7876829.1 hypothetical protein C8R40DRAFT_1041968 [Lentinula edodes]
MADTSSSKPHSPKQPSEFRKKDGTYSKMRSHAGNIPVLPQTKLCPFCPAKFTRTTHLNRHLRNHTNERVHKCDLCEAQFTRSDLLSRHRKGCNQTSNVRRKSCVSCAESKVKCDRELPCSKCSSRGIECVYAAVTKKVHRIHQLATTDFPEATHSKFSLSPVFGNTSSTIPNDPSDFSLAPTTTDITKSSRDSTSVTSTETSSHIPINSHLVSLYNCDVFEPFFSDVFSTTVDNSLQTPIGRGNKEYVWINFDPGQNNVSQKDTPTTTTSSASLRSAISDATTETAMGSLLEQEDNEKRHYLHLFYSGFVEQVPVVHAPSFSPEGKPPFLINAMQACGAIFVKSKTAAAFIATTLKSSRKVLSEELSRDLLTIEEQLNLILTVVLLHTLGMYHEDAEERAASSLYHGMLITMIRGADFISHVATWSADEDNHLSLEEHWRHWAWHEMSKRTLLLSYLQDASQSIYFTVPSSYHIAELNFNLPCDDKLWRAQSASEWWSELHRGSPYGDAHDRLNCPTLPSLLQLVFEPRTTQVKAISHFAHWAVIHGIISCLFTLCTKGHLPVQRSFGANGDPLNQELYRIQFAMHNWLDWWMKRPEVIENTREEAELPFMQNPLPFYWLGQVALMAYQENLPPFNDQANLSMNLRMDVRFWQVKKWIRHIRSFLAGARGHTPTILWDELMNIRLQSWQVSLEHPAKDDPLGLLGFFVQ